MDSVDEPGKEYWENSGRFDLNHAGKNWIVGEPFGIYDKAVEFNAPPFLACQVDGGSGQ